MPSCLPARHLDCLTDASSQPTDRGRLCAGVARILAASCEDLMSVDWLTEAIGRIGLVPDTRHSRLYGSAASYMVGSTKAGLWQDPRQLATALLEATAHHQAQSYLEIGVYTAWTTCVNSGYLARMASAGSGFEGVAVDRSDEHIHLSTASLFKQLNVSFVRRDAFDKTLLLPGSPPRFDVCFIDADHTYDGVRADFEAVAGRCRTLLFHDVMDTTTLKLPTNPTARPFFLGGVPLFWLHLLTRVAPHRARTISEQHSSFLPMFGIGLLLPNAHGTGLPEVSALERPWPHFAAAHRLGTHWQRFLRPCQSTAASCPWRLLTNPALSRELRTRKSFTLAELNALLAPGGTIHAEDYVESAGHFFRPETDPARAHAALWHELCLTRNYSSVHGLLRPASRYRHPLCAVSTPDDFGIFLSAAERRVKRGYLTYAARRWYCSRSDVPAERCDAMPSWAPNGSMPGGWLGAGPLLEWAGRLR